MSGSRRFKLSPEETLQMEEIERRLREEKSMDFTQGDDPYLAGANSNVLPDVELVDPLLAEVQGRFRRFQSCQGEELEQLPSAVPVSCCRDVCFRFASGHIAHL